MCIVPPIELMDTVQMIRTAHDKSFYTWMPHINLLWPFVPSGHFDHVSEILLNDLEFNTIAPFNIRLERFHNNENSKYIHLIPETDYVPTAPTSRRPKKGRKKNQQSETELVNPISKIYNIVKRLFPQCATDKPFEPHLTVGQIPQDEIDQYRKEFQQEWEVINFQVEHISLICKKGSSFREVTSIPLLG
eukprot:TRINITY_DN9916_c0_g1_i1.p1 TRINITY_DN9916_c0_g1~~TRINITY_DN9916_c0_g1_i1.p1  ORF type:complete len:207 (-),score=33.18 TRINITY_DN9916_c0_g1_i1:245-814(-)